MAKKRKSETPAVASRARINVSRRLRARKFASTSTPSTRCRLGGLAVLVFTARRQAEASRFTYGTPYVQLLDAGDTKCLPVVTARVNPALNAPYDDIDLQHAIAQEHWYVCGYKMNMK